MRKSDKPYGRQIRTIDTILADSPSEQTVQSASIDSIQLPKKQPRRYFDSEKINQLIQSIKEHGILEPLLVRPIPGGNYELVAGERRLRAAQQIGLAEVPIVAHELDDKQAIQVSLIENLQREDLNPVEETEGVLELLAIELGKPKNEVVSLLYRMQKEAKGKTAHNVVGYPDSQTIETTFNALGLLSWESFVNHRLPLLNLPEDILAALQQGKLEYTKARAIARLKDDQQREALLEDAITKSLSLSKIKERITALLVVNKGQKPENIKQQFDGIYQQIKKSEAWDDPRKQRKLEKILAELQALLDQS